MPERTPDNQNNAQGKFKYLNTLLWVLIVVVAVVLGAWTIWASHQPAVHSIWAPDE